MSLYEQLEVLAWSFFPHRQLQGPSYPTAAAVQPPWRAAARFLKTQQISKRHCQAVKSPVRGPCCFRLRFRKVLKDSLNRDSHILRL